MSFNSYNKQEALTEVEMWFDCDRSQIDNRVTLVISSSVLNLLTKHWVKLQPVNTVVVKLTVYCHTFSLPWQWKLQNNTKNVFFQLNIPLGHNISI